MMRTHLVKPGECIASIAYGYGVPLASLAEANPELEAERGDLGILAEGDVVNVPTVAPKTEDVDGSGAYVIRLHGSVSPVTLCFVRVSGEPRSDEPVVLKVDGFAGQQSQRTDDDGRATFMIPARATTGTLLLGDNRFAMPVTFGDLDPLSTVRGVQSRLMHLGYYSHAVDGKVGPYTYQALRAFQLDNQLEPNDELDEQTLARLRERSGA